MDWYASTKLAEANIREKILSVLEHVTKEVAERWPNGGKVAGRHWASRVVAAPQIANLSGRRRFNLYKYFLYDHPSGSHGSLASF